MTGIKNMEIPANKTLTLADALTYAVKEAHKSGKANRFHDGAYQTEYHICMDTTRHPFGRYEATEAENAAHEGEFDSVRDAVEAWVEGAYSEEADEAVADTVSLLSDFLTRHPELTVEGYTGEDEQEQEENIDDMAREIGVVYPDYQDIYESCGTCDYDGDGWDE